MKRTKTQTIGDILNEFFKRPYVAAKVAEGRLEEYWREIVGDYVAEHTRSLKLDNHVLYVVVNSGVVRNELFFRRDELMKLLNERAGIKLINALIVR
jgi:predicted nucleic acid-binding Zn ribbon protein